MADLIDRQAAIDRINKQREHLEPDVYPQDKIGDAAYRVCAEFIERLPSAQGDAEFISWLLDEIWDEEMWELNYRAFPELLCRRLVRLGYLKEEGGKYVRLDK